VNVPTTTPAPTSFPWGVVGSLHAAGDLRDEARSYGVIRHVSSGITYAPPPTPNGWFAVRAEPGRFDLPWPSNPAAARSLAALRTDLTPLARGVDPASPLLAELDAVAYQLLRQAESLHAAEWRLGLIQPSNVVWPSSAEVSPTLIDLGFVWKGDYGSFPWTDSPGRPKWLETNLERNPAAWLWDHEPVRRQFAMPDPDVCEAVPASADVKTLARLLAWVLTGRRDRAIAEPADDAPGRKTWLALHLASTGRLESLSAFAQMLAESPLSRHFAAPEVPKRKSRVGLWLVGLLAVGGAAAYFLTTRNFDPAIGGLTAPPGSVDEALANFDAATIDERFAIVEKLSGTDAPEAVQAKVRELRTQVVDDWEVVFRRLETRASEDVAGRYEIGERMKELRDHLTKLLATPGGSAEQQERERQCLEHAALRCEELGYPR